MSAPSPLWAVPLIPAPEQMVVLGCMKKQGEKDRRSRAACSTPLCLLLQLLPHGFCSARVSVLTSLSDELLLGSVRRNKPFPSQVPLFMVFIVMIEKQRRTDLCSAFGAERGFLSYSSD